eukprot:TRINITY_DN653_c0_g1_i4.p1 TRINITY_DN653_c0_g1~~TRINITY_DN653_c0_g1_i4.p1  ORF type:complete len:410 (-),score=89.21 TRINITY_DN653_c0_g1_i4:98-1327(-)
MSDNPENDENKKAKKSDELSKGLTEMKISAKKTDTLIIEANGVSYECVGRTGKGSFGVVYKAIESGSRRVVAIKRVLQDPRYKNRELQIMKMVNHPNTVELLNNFVEKSEGKVFLNLVLGYVPKNLYEVSSSYNKRKEQMPTALVQMYIYQLLRSLAYIHSLGICHRDIKPQNLLINTETNELKLCDFGSAKILVPGEPNVSYICSRYYRAPELIFEASDYTPAIDVWSSGCVMAELILGHPIFAGENGADQLVAIIKVLGTPSSQEIKAMNKAYEERQSFPFFKQRPWQKLFPPDTPKTALDIISKMLVYIPTDRVKPLEACAHSFFDPLRSNSGPTSSSSSSTNPTLSTSPPSTSHTSYKQPEKIFHFTQEEVSYATKNGFIEKLLPLGQTTPTKFDANTAIYDTAK